MGFDDGSIVGDEGENAVCKEFKGEDHCGPDDLDILYTDLDCRGQENELLDCGGTKDTSLCNHE